jgi:hypothetical protein
VRFHDTGYGYFHRPTEFWGIRVDLEVTSTLPGYSFLKADNVVTLTISFVDRPIDDDSWTEIVIWSKDVRSDYAAMEDRGVPFESPLGAPIMFRDGQDMVEAHFQDPDGHYGRLSGWVDSEWLAHNDICRRLPKPAPVAIVVG